MGTIEACHSRVVYVYFDYKNPKSQSGEDIIRCLLKQLLCRSNLVPRDVEALFDEFNNRSTSPNLPTFIRLFISLSSQFSTIYVMLDALDECSPENLKDVIALVGQLNDSNIKVFCTSRNYFPDLRNQLGALTILHIEADPDDLRNYLSIKLNEEWKFDDASKVIIKDKLADRAEGKLDSSFCISLTC